MRSAETLLHRNLSVYGTRRAKCGIPHDLEREDKRLKKGKSVFRRNGDVMVQVWKERLVRIIMTIHDATIVNKGRKDRKTNIEIKKPYAVQYSKFIKDVDRADQCLTNYLVLKKTVKWSKKVVLYMLNCVLFNAFFVYSTLNTNEVKELRA